MVRSMCRSFRLGLKNFPHVRFWLAFCATMYYCYFKTNPSHKPVCRFVNSTSHCTRYLQPLSIPSFHRDLIDNSRRALTRSQVLRSTAAHSPLAPLFYLTISQNLKQAFIDGIYLKDGPPAPKKVAKGGTESDEPESPQLPSLFSDPSQMDNMMSQFKTQTVIMIPQMVIMGWVNFFFSGFVASKCRDCVELFMAHALLFLFP